MASNIEIEERWIEAWNDLYDLMAEAPDCEFVLLPSQDCVSLDECQGWIQSMVYEGYLVSMRRYRRKDHRWKIFLKCFREGEVQPKWVSKTEDGFVLEDGPTAA